MTEEINENTTNPSATTTDNVTTIKAVNPTKEEIENLKSTIKANYNFAVNVKETVFTFKTQKDKDTGLKTKRESLVLMLPYPSVEGIIAIMEAGGLQMELLMEAVESIVNVQARSLISDDDKYVLNAATFPVDNLSWEAIANMPKAQRRGGGIPKETWEEFAADYLDVMPDATGKSSEQIANMVKILINKLNNVKTSKPILEMVKVQLAVYAEATSSLEDYAECVEFLLKKADTCLNISAEEILSAL